MAHLTAADLAEITSGTWVNAPPDDWRPKRVCFRGRAKHQCLVIPKDPFFGGVDLSQADPLTLQSCALLVNEDFQGLPFLPQLRVRSVREAAAAIAAQARKRYRGIICAVTGSVGKSSTCTLLRHALRRFGSCAANYPYGNIHRSIIARTTALSEEQFAVIEVAGPSRIQESSCVLRPHLVILTAITPAHLEAAGTVAELAARKAGIFAGLEPGGIAVINRGIPLYENVSDLARKHTQNVIPYGEHAEAAVTLLNYSLQRQLVRANVHGEVIEYPLGMNGKHMALNSLAALAAIHALGLDWRKAASEFGYAELPPGRGRRYKARIGGKRVLLIDDAYNANPASVVAAIELLAGLMPSPGGKRIAVLADMLELGPDEPRFHAELVQPIVEAGIDRVYLAGQLMTHLWKELPVHLHGRRVETVEELLPILQKEIGEGDVILFKGSHASNLFTMVQSLRELDEPSTSAAPTLTKAVVGRSERFIQRLFLCPGRARERRRGTFTLTFCGDTSLGDYFMNRYTEWRDVQRRLRRDPFSFFEDVKPLISGSDCLIANLETTLVTGIQSPLQGQKRHVIWDHPKRTATVLKGIGVTAVNLANNHAMDFGSDGLLQTIAVLKACGISVFGAGDNRRAASNPLMRRMRVAGREKTLWVIAGYEVNQIYKESLGYYATATSPGVNPVSQGVIACIERLRAQDPEALIVTCPHWLQNYRWASEKEIDLASALRTAGADIVIGTGAHMLGQCHWSESGTLVLSLGDFIFNWRGFYRYHSAPPFSLIARLDISPDGEGWASALRLYPIVTDNRQTGFRVQPVGPAMLASVYALLAEHATDASAFPRHFEPAEDERGLHIRLTRPISPRFACVISP